MASLAACSTGGRRGWAEKRAVGKGHPGRLESRPQARKPAPHRTRHGGHAEGKPQRGRAATKQVWRHKKSSRAEKNLRASSTEDTEDTEMGREGAGRGGVRGRAGRMALIPPYRSGLCGSAGVTAGMASLAACSTQASGVASKTACSTGAPVWQAWRLAPQEMPAADNNVCPTSAGGRPGGLPGENSLLHSAA